MSAPRRLDAIFKATLAELQSLFASTEGSKQAPEVWIAIAERALSLGEPLLAYDVCRTGLSGSPDHVGLRQLEALALARSGATEHARELLEGLYHSESRDPKTTAMLARILKDQALQVALNPGSESRLGQSLRLYMEAYDAGAGTWAAINAATLAFVLDDKPFAIQLARRVKDECLSTGDEIATDAWRLATLGEAALILGNFEEAKSFYADAAQAGAGFGDRATMRRNARLVLGAPGGRDGVLDLLIPPPAIAIFAGHMQDAPDRPVARFPESVSPAAGRAIRKRLELDDVQIGYASAASGGDLLFHEAMLSLGRETHVVLAEPPLTFLQTSVRDGREEWVKRFWLVLKQAASVTIHSTSSSGDIGYAYNNWMILGLARLRANQVDGSLRALALWDGKSGLPGGTATAVADWQIFGQSVLWIEPPRSKSAVLSDWHETSREVQVDVPRALNSQRIVSMLFADAVGFSKLSDEQVPRFVESFLGLVAIVLDRQPEPALTRNTWGDGLYFTFATPRATGLFSLELCETIAKTDWAARGLPVDLSLRVALHCGPAHEVIDPVLKQRNYTGTHVSRAARIEPVTPPGRVYASQSFAALSACERITEFACDYVGRMPLAKKFGEWPTFNVRRL